MSDVNAHIIQPLKKFAKDSAHLVKKCTKPDRKGACVVVRVAACRVCADWPHSCCAPRLDLSPIYQHPPNHKQSSPG